MAYDEVLQYNSEERFSIAFPMVSKIEISVESNPNSIKSYASNSVRKLVLDRPVEFLGNANVDPRYNFCSNPLCWGNQISLISLCDKQILRPVGNSAFSEKVRCLGSEVRRPISQNEIYVKNIDDKERKYTAFEKDGFRLEFGFIGIKCGNLMNISGYIECSKKI